MATATVCALFNLPCVVYMGETDIARQQPNVFRMKLLGAEVMPVKSGSRTLKDAMNEALRDWVANVENTFYIIGTVAGPHPYPAMVRDFQSVIGREVREQMMKAEGRLPDTLVACIGGGSNAIGLFHPVPRRSRSVAMYGVEAGGHGIETGEHAASHHRRTSPACCTATAPTCCRTTTARSSRRTRISAGLDYPGIGPEHSWLHDMRPREVRVRHRQARRWTAFQLLLAHSRASSRRSSRRTRWPMSRGSRRQAAEGPHLLVMNLCGRGDKDIFTVAERAGHQAVRLPHEFRRLAAELRLPPIRPHRQAFAALKQEGRGGLVTFVTAGDPDLETSLEIARRACRRPAPI